MYYFYSPPPPFYPNYYYQQPVQFLPRNTQTIDESRGSWTPFSWVEKYNYRFNGPENKAEIALTFDDGPDPDFTPTILEKLAKYNVLATFFLLGENAEKYPEIAKDIVAAGHIIGNHTYTHPKSTKLDLDSFKHEVGQADELLTTLSGYRPKFFRPPYGDIDAEKLEWLTKQELFTVQWNLDTDDWRGLSADVITQKVASGAYPGSIVLQHNAKGVPLQGTVDALDLFIPQMQAKGVRFVTLPEMFSTTKER